MTSKKLALLLLIGIMVFPLLQVNTLNHATIGVNPSNTEAHDQDDELISNLTNKFTSQHFFESYKFIKYGDTQESSVGDNSGPEATYNLILELLDQHDISFILMSGDLVEFGAEQEDYDTYYWPYMNQIKENCENIYFAAGNHDYKGYGVGNDEKDLNTFRANVWNPGNEIYYSFNTPQNDTHIIVLNSEYYFEDVNETRQNLQQTFLENDLASNSINRTIVMFHRPVWGVNPARVETDYEPLRAVWHDFFVEHDIEMVFNGHDHHFYKTNRNGTNYIISGGGATSLTLPILDHPDVQEYLKEDDVWIEGNHVTLYEVTEEGFNYQVIMTNGTVAAEFFVEAPREDNFAPVLSSPDDLTITEGTETDMEWTILDESNGTYDIMLDDEIVEQGGWQNDSIISYPLDDLSVGLHTLILNATDVNGNMALDEVEIEVTEETSQTSTSSTESSSAPEDTTTNFGIDIFIATFISLSILVYFTRKNY